MYVRLAFAVSAFLEPEILIIDEVLAVGDAEFQKKCLGRMQHVSVNDGRTVLFVSHNMGVISQLCRNSIMLKNGTVFKTGATGKVIEEYLAATNLNTGFYSVDKESKAKENFFTLIKTVNSNNETTENFQFNENIILDVKLCIRNFNPVSKISVTLQNVAGEYLSTFVEDLSDFYKTEDVAFKIKLPSHLISPNSYFFRLAVFVPNGIVYDLVEMVCPIKIFDTGSEMSLFEGINYGSFTMAYEII
jgi:lipopolysaccharide transport system ATP-binding protein